MKQITHKDKNRTKNKYQIGIIFAVIGAMIYGYALYLAVRIHKTSAIYINAGIMTAWFLLAIYWLRQLGHISKAEFEEKEKQKEIDKAQSDQA
ncbi:MAG TPA: hypothetical protein VL053_02340 [Arachidicoccus sp.]|nr:hypothetical protein [Arachidicoccus sp.]